VVLDSYGGPTSAFRNNTIVRGGATNVKAAIEVHGAFKLIGNHIVGFDEPGSAALLLTPDPLGRAPASLYRDNIFERCAAVVKETRKGLWAASNVGENVFIHCSCTPKE